MVLGTSWYDVPGRVLEVSQLTNFENSPKINHYSNKTKAFICEKIIIDIAK